MSNYAIINALPRIHDMSSEDGLFVEFFVSSFTAKTPKPKSPCACFWKKALVKFKKSEGAPWPRLLRNLKPDELLVFWLVGQHPGVRQGMIAKKLCIKQAHMSTLQRGLEERNFVTRDIPDNDRRSVLLNVTPTGQRFLDRIQNGFLAIRLPAMTR